MDTILIPILIIIVICCLLYAIQKVLKIEKRSLLSQDMHKRKKDTNPNDYIDYQKFEEDDDTTEYIDFMNSKVMCALLVDKNEQ